jgi:hypothetical protein
VLPTWFVATADQASQSRHLQHCVVDVVLSLAHGARQAPHELKPCSVIPNVEFMRVRMFCARSGTSAARSPLAHPVGEELLPGPMSHGLLGRQVSAGSERTGGLHRLVIGGCRWLSGAYLSGLHRYLETYSSDRMI